MTRPRRQVHLVIGFNNCGKSWYVEHELRPRLGLVAEQCLDILAVQQELWPDGVNPSTRQILRSYWVLRRRMLDRLRQYDTVVVEHTLLKRVRRAWFTGKLRQRYGADVQLVCHWFALDDFPRWFANYRHRCPATISKVSPAVSDEQFAEDRKHLERWYEAKARDLFDRGAAVFEPPAADEGFDELIRR